MSSHTPGPWAVDEQGRIYHRPDPLTKFVIAVMESSSEADARLIASAPNLLAALLAEDKADEAFDAADEYTHRAEAEDWLNDPTGSMHVTEAWDRAHMLRVEAKELRRAAISKAGGAA